MTAEVVLINKSAAVLAADSAVTISGDHGFKTYNSASKIAALSYDPPIGAVVYGDSEILGIPWESIKRMYSDEFRKGNHPKDTVADVADDFFTWIDSQADWLFRRLEERRAVESADQSLASVFAAVERAQDVTPDDAAIAYVDAELRSSEVDPQAAQRTQVDALSDLGYQADPAPDERRGAGGHRVARASRRRPADGPGMHDRHAHVPDDDQVDPAVPGASLRNSHFALPAQAASERGPNKFLPHPRKPREFCSRGD